VKTKTLNDLGEAGIIQLIQEKGPARLPSHLKKGIGDDCAVLKTTGDRALLVTTDTLIEGIHFTAELLPPEALGWKALAVNISDIASMGGTPHTAFLSVGMKPETEVSFIETFMAGFQALASRTDIVLAGGDTVESPSSAVITVTLLGDCLPEHLVYRSGAGVGDDVWVTGPLGNRVRNASFGTPEADTSPQHGERSGKKRPRTRHDRYLGWYRQRPWPYL
jgi:thiamine-monophosphate kinase